MTLAAAGLWITSLWLVIYAVKHSSRRTKFLLPFSHHRRPTIEVTVKHLNIRLKTEAFNAFHDELSARLSPNNSRMSRQILLRTYDLGSFVAVIGMLFGFSLLVFTAVSLFLEVVQTRHDPSPVTKRDLNYVGNPTPPLASTSNALRINPIIPGLTVPLGHLPLILVALAASQIVHEAGHAIAAALHRIPMLSCGITVTVLFPSAFVTLLASPLEKLPARDRLQIMSGGCFHNFVLLCLLFSATWLGAGVLPTSILFQDISSLGRLVVGVDHDSPLAMHLPVGTLISKIDDTSMASVSSDDPWGRNLLSPSLGSLQGWCAHNDHLDKASSPACVSTGSYSCFVSKADNTIQYELDPVLIFSDSLPRCNYSTECPSLSSCVAPRSGEQLIRISVLRSHGGEGVEEIVVWKGPKEEIWEQVQVGYLRPRFPLVPSKLPEFASAFFEYMKIANLSLYLVNMLPITGLDGYQTLVVLLQLFFSQVSDGLESIDLEALNVTRLSREGRVQQICRSFLSFSAFLLVVLCALLGIISWATK